MNTFSIIETGGKQYKVAPGDTLQIEKLSVAEPGSTVVFEHVLLRSDGDAVSVGAPYVSGATVTAEVLGAIRGEKKIIFRYHSKTRYRKKKGHRQPYTKIKIISV